MILHNIFLDLGDSPAEIPGFDPDDKDANVLQDLLASNARLHVLEDRRQAQEVAEVRGAVQESPEALKLMGRAFREGIMSSLGI